MASAHPHVHDTPDGAGLVAAASAVLQASGEQWTVMRAAVFSALAAFDKPASAYDIAEATSRSLGRRVAANTVYRILDLFVAAHVATRVESRNAYLANAHPGCLHDCIFLVCDDCGATTHIDDDQVSASVRAKAEVSGFIAVRPVIEVRGRCVDCA